jgi:glycerophosphoryl diester phosphodiesterase
MSPKLYQIILFLLLSITYAEAQKWHSHNDYEQTKPFYQAYELGFDSIEADLFLKEGELYVAHESENILSQNTFRKLYLEPLLLKIKENDGFAYKNKQKLQLLIDLKSNGREILMVLFEQLKPHKRALKNIKIVISGDMPKPEEFKNYDEIFFFDGRSNSNYSAKAWKRVGLVSASFKDFGESWDGINPLDDKTADKINTFVESIHAKQREVRLWATPNTTLAFETLQRLDLDYIGTDDLVLLSKLPKQTLFRKFFE